VQSREGRAIGNIAEGFAWPSTQTLAGPIRVLAYQMRRGRGCGSGRSGGSESGLDDRKTFCSSRKFRFTIRIAGASRAGRGVFFHQRGEFRIDRVGDVMNLQFRPMGLVRTISGQPLRGCDDVQREGREMGELGRQLWGGVVVHREGPPAELRAVATGVEIPAAIRG